MEKVFESERLIFKPFSELNDTQIKVVGDSWANPFNARYNAMKDPHGSAKETTTWSEPTEWNNYYRVVFLKDSEEIIGTCRFGQYHGSTTDDCWDFGFNVVLKHWFKGYGVEILSKIVEVAKTHNVKTIRGGADIENYGSYRAMIKNGFDYVGYDDDGDYEYILQVNQKQKTKEEIEKNWDNHINRTRNDFGETRFNNLQHINKQIYEMVSRIQNGEDESQLVKQYFNKLNLIEEFKFCWLMF